MERDTHTKTDNKIETHIHTRRAGERHKHTQRQDRKVKIGFMAIKLDLKIGFC